MMTISKEGCFRKEAGITTAAELTAKLLNLFRIRAVESGNFSTWNRSGGAGMGSGDITPANQTYIHRHIGPIATTK
jgi:hypothetical protein